MESFRRTIGKSFSSIIAVVLALVFATSALEPAFATANAESHIKLARKLLVRQEFDLALKELNAALVLQPDNVDALIERGTAFNELGKYDNAIADLSRAIAKSSNRYLAYNNRGVSHLRKKEYGKAIQDFDAATKLAPGEIIPYLNRAGAALCIGKGAEEAKRLKALLEKRGYKSQLSMHGAILAALGLRQGKQEKACIELLNTAIAKGDRFNWPYPAMNYLVGKTKTEALLKESEDSDYDTTQAYCFIALNKILKGEKQQAKPYLSWVVQHGLRNTVEYWVAREFSTR